jgi:hypothetical protein
MYGWSRVNAPGVMGYIMCGRGGRCKAHTLCGFMILPGLLNVTKALIRSFLYSIEWHFSGIRRWLFQWNGIRGGLF